MNERLGVLYLEDEPDFVALVKELLESDGFRVNLEVVDNGTDFVAALERRTFNLVLADYQLPTCNGLQALNWSREKAPDTPFLLVSGVLGQQAAVDSLKSGATDYVLKREINRLVPAVRRAVAEAEERRRAREELRAAQAELVHASHLAGMAELATALLHNIGNVLNSVNVSVSLFAKDLQESKTPSLSRVAALLCEHEADLCQFLTRDPKGRQLPNYLTQLAEHLTRKEGALLGELERIQHNLGHIKAVVSLQQNYAKTSSASETLCGTDLMEDALLMSNGAKLHDVVQIKRDYDPHLPQVTVQKHKALQILVNLIRNAQHACQESGRPDQRLTLRSRQSGGHLRLEVSDNGVGIAPENLSRLFTFGFTTRKTGHGFGLYSAALAARQLGGELHAQSDGLGRGATFSLDLPLRP